MLQFGMTANCSFFQADHFAIYPHFARIGCVGSHVILRRIGNVGSHVLTNALPGSHSHIPRSPGARIEQSVATFCDERSNICMAELPWNGKASSVSMNRVFGVGCARLPRKAPTFPTHNANVRWATKTMTHSKWSGVKNRGIDAPGKKIKVDLRVEYRTHDHRLFQ